MRAIQLQEFGGPEVLELVGAAETRARRRARCSSRSTRAGMNFADTHQRENSYLASNELPLIPGTEVAGVRADTGERVVALCGTGGYAEYVAVPAGAHVPDPRRRRRRRRARAAAAGPDRLAPVHDVRARWRRASRSSCIAAAGGVGSLAVQLGSRSAPAA